MTTTYNADYFFHSTYTAKWAQFNKIRDCFSGNEKIKEEGVTYLPKPSGMDDDAYSAYKARAFFYPVVERTVRGLTGTMFQIPPAFDLPEKLEYMLEDATPDGDSLQHSTREAAEEVILMGRFGILVDLPADAGGRPYISHYKAEDITNWQREFVNGKRMLTRIMLREGSPIEYGSSDEHRFLELFLDVERNDKGEAVGEPVYRARTWKLKFSKRSKGQVGGPVGESRPAFQDYDYAAINEEPETVTPSIQGKPLNYIPFCFINPMSVKPELEKSPLLDLCDANVSHYTIHADWRHGLFMLAQPTPYIIGDLDDDEVPKKVGASAFWVLPSSVEDVGMLEFSGAGIESLRMGLDKQEDYMAALGAKLIHRQDVEETAEAVKVKTRESLSVIENVVLSLSEAYNAALRIAAEWMKSKPEETTAAFNSEFVQVEMSEGKLAAMVKAWQEGAISRETYHRNLQRGQIIEHDRTIEDEEEAIEKEREERQKRAEEMRKKMQEQAGGDEDGDDVPPDEKDEDEEEDER